MKQRLLIQGMFTLLLITGITITGHSMAMHQSALTFNHTKTNRQQTVAGTVVDATDGTPIAGATIRVRGTSIAVRSTNDGHYSVTGVKTDDVLVVSYLGYRIHEEPMGGRTHIVIELGRVEDVLEEVVVTALGIRREEKSLLVIDGVPYGNMGLRQIAPDDIESIDVLKGPQAYYAIGIQGAMQFVADQTPNNTSYHHNRILSDAYIETFPTTDAVKLTGAAEHQIEQITTQKFHNNYLKSPLSAFFENRRTGYPEFPINPASNENIPADRLPIRWMYPSDEVNYNSENMSEAIDRQYNGSDNVNERMWLLKD